MAALPFVHYIPFTYENINKEVCKAILLWEPGFIDDHPFAKKMDVIFRDGIYAYNIAVDKNICSELPGEVHASTLVIDKKMDHGKIYVYKVQGKRSTLVDDRNISRYGEVIELLADVVAEDMLSLEVIVSLRKDIETFPLAFRNFIVSQFDGNRGYPVMMGEVDNIHVYLPETVLSKDYFEEFWYRGEVVHYIHQNEQTIWELEEEGKRERMCHIYYIVYNLMTRGKNLSPIVVRSLVMRDEDFLKGIKRKPYVNLTGTLTLMMKDGEVIVSGAFASLCGTLCNMLDDSGTVKDGVIPKDFPTIPIDGYTMEDVKFLLAFNLRVPGHMPVTPQVLASALNLADFLDYRHLSNIAKDIRPEFMAMTDCSKVGRVFRAFEAFLGAPPSTYEEFFEDIVRHACKNKEIYSCLADIYWGPASRPGIEWV
jgi:hypothetical protein